MSEDFYRWEGQAEPCLDLPSMATFGNIRVGQYGGNVGAGADKNEDGLLLLRSPGGEWEFAAIVDAHDSSDSAKLVLDAIADIRAELRAIMDSPGSDATFRKLETRFEALFRDEEFRARCRTIRGECSCLVACRKGRHVWWFSVGDCMLYVLHPDLAAFGQTLQNQRNFYEWIGRDHSFDDEALAYSTGTRKLRPGTSLVVLATDGFLEPGVDPATTPERWSALRSLDEAVATFVANLHEARTKDSTTVIAWPVTTA